MQTSDPDARLMLAFREGDASALAELYRRWAAPVRRFLLRMVGEPAMAEDLTQETFVRVHGARDRYAPEARFSTWLFRIARNLALNELDIRSLPLSLQAGLGYNHPHAVRRSHFGFAMSADQERGSFKLNGL